MSDVPLHRSRYPDYDVLAQSETWDAVTRQLVLKRVHAPPPIRFLSAQEARTIEAFADTVVPQDDRPPEVRIPIVRFLDEQLHENTGDGYRYETLPPPRELWRTLVRALDEEAGTRHGLAFADLTPGQRAHLVEDLAAESLRLAHAAQEAPQGGPPSAGARLGSPLWEKLDLRLGFAVVVGKLAQEYYAHPYAWSEIGYGGPVFPRIYVRTTRANPQEAQEVPL